MAGDHIPVEPRVHVERYPTHLTLSWQAGPLAAFVAALAATDDIPGTAPVVVDEGSAAERQQVRVTDLDARPAVQYLRVEPRAGWRVSWERRTRPVVSVSGNPPPAPCRRLHERTTDCEGWSPDARRMLDRVLER